MSRQNVDVVIRNTRPDDFDSIIAMTRAIYPHSVPWSKEQLSSHLQVFPDGQFVAVESGSERILGMASSLIILWDDYHIAADWRDFTDHGMFRNHDPIQGRTLYGAEIIVDPSCQGCGIGSKLYVDRRLLVQRLGLLRIRAGARLRGYHQYASQLTPEEYVFKVVHEELRDPTLSFQLRHGFEVLAVVSGYLRNDSESLGNAAVIEWINPEVAKADDYANRDSKFFKKKP